MNLTMQDITTLEVLAYHRLLVRRYDEALPIYQFLGELQPDAHKWKLAQTVCLIHRHAYADADQIIKTISIEGIDQHESDLLAQLNQHIAHYETGASNTYRPHRS